MTTMYISKLLLIVALIGVVLSKTDVPTFNKDSTLKAQNPAKNLDLSTKKADISAKNPAVSSKKSVASTDTCQEIEAAFQSVVEANEEPACRCMPKGFGGHDDEGYVFVGCTRQNMPSIYRALNVLNETNMTQLKIWNSLLNILPTDLFSKVRPKVLSIENSGVSVFRKGAFSNLGSRLQSLYLMNNILKNFDKHTFNELSNLEMLDMSGNKLSAIKADQFGPLAKLEHLHLTNNQIQEIENGAFALLKNLKVLHLAGNALSNITKDTFKGLENLEVLQLENNNLKNIDAGAFSGMKKLKVLDLGHNSLHNIQLESLPQLETLLLNNNKLQSMKSVTLKSIPKLSTLNFDNNNIVQIASNDMDYLTESRELNSLSFVANNMTHIDASAFRYCPKLTILSLQNNNLTSLSSVPKGGNGAVSWLKPLTNLKSLFLTWNQISVLKNGELNVIPSLEEVSMDHNKLGTIDKEALTGLQLKKLFLNGNELYYLPEGLFQGWNTENIYSVDLAENPWECICGHEWIGEWLRKLGDRSTPSGNVGCLAYHCGNDVEETPKHSAWITVVAGILAFVALLFLAAIAYLYIQETCGRAPIPLKRIPSDMVRLIPSMESLSFPNPVAGELGKPIIKPTTPPEDGKKDENDKKRVRFNGV
ncbi:unnamed protein product [Bursaphelenchus okinawaensis]|uniref:LRRCT domain-containing protein n=1 Tax=Bursaphelenchus okinawaensis TaxID=465554 RepID=A0A811KMD6_9BILA|nr:unnamed protein product [Bursaphelenchus okinawaensis]CAG9106621.1 unnamed protein product [Bursaphelenchus okinawaensis]